MTQLCYWQKRIGHKPCLGREAGPQERPQVPERKEKRKNRVAQASLGRGRLAKRRLHFKFQWERNRAQLEKEGSQEMIAVSNAGASCPQEETALQESTEQ